MPTQVESGKAFEYSVINAYYQQLSARGLIVEVAENAPLATARACYQLFGVNERARFDSAANKSVNTLCVLEPGLVTQQGLDDVLAIRLAADAEGQAGDVRDVIFSRQNSAPAWQIGISAKNNHDDVKHSRLSSTIDFGGDWLGLNCSPQYFAEINLVFDWIRQLLQLNPQATWAGLGVDKRTKAYQPVLEAFRKELIRLAVTDATVPAKLLSYLIGRYAFYKVIKNDQNRCVEIKGFNINGGLNKPRAGVRPAHGVDPFRLPTQIISFGLKPGSDTTLIMVLDHGWQISFRIHSAETRLIPSLKFAIKLIGNPPILFTQHLFI